MLFPFSRFIVEPDITFNSTFVSIISNHARVLNVSTCTFPGWNSQSTSIPELRDKLHASLAYRLHWHYSIYDSRHHSGTSSSARMPIWPVPWMSADNYRWAHGSLRRRQWIYSSSAALRRQKMWQTIELPEWRSACAIYFDFESTHKSPFPDEIGHRRMDIVGAQSMKQIQFRCRPDSTTGLSIAFQIGNRSSSVGEEKQRKPMNINMHCLRLPWWIGQPSLGLMTCLAAIYDIKLYNIYIYYIILLCTRTNYLLCYTERMEIWRDILAAEYPCNRVRCLAKHSAVSIVWKQ